MLACFTVQQKTGRDVSVGRGRCLFCGGGSKSKLAVYKMKMWSNSIAVREFFGGGTGTRDRDAGTDGTDHELM